MLFARTLRNIAEIILTKAEEELHNPAKIKEALLQLQLQLDMGKISEEEYETKEDELLERLEKTSET